MGTPAFPQLLFDKVYQDDITRLRTMEEMWKTRRLPQPLSYANITEQGNGSQKSTEEILKGGQRVWTLEENVAVFKDRSVFPYPLSTDLGVNLDKSGEIK